MGPEGDILTMVTQSEEDIPHTEGIPSYEVGEGQLEEDVFSPQVLSIDALLGDIFELNFFLA